ncbi:MAG: carbon storage regulator [Arenicella sp.]
MLVLTRKLDEEVIITVGSTEVAVSVVNVLGSKFQLGFDAPNDVSILRSELLNTKGDNNEVDTKQKPKKGWNDGWKNCFFNRFQR